MAAPIVEQAAKTAAAAAQHAFRITPPGYTPYVVPRVMPGPRIMPAPRTLPRPSPKLAPKLEPKLDPKLDPKKKEKCKNCDDECEKIRICFMPKSDKIDMAEFRRQLKLQEAAINRMSPTQLLANRGAYLADKAGMRALSKPLQNATRLEYEESLTGEYQARYGANWQAQLDSHMKSVAALHNQDMIAGGDYRSVADPTIPLKNRMGGLSENSSMGSQWEKNRAQWLEDHAQRMKEKNCPVNAELEICENYETTTIMA